MLCHQMEPHLLVNLGFFYLVEDPILAKLAITSPCNAHCHQLHVLCQSF